MGSRVAGKPYRIAPRPRVGNLLSRAPVTALRRSPAPIHVTELTASRNSRDKPATGVPVSNPVNDDPAVPTAAEYRQRTQRARAHAWARYRAHLHEVFSRHGVDNSGALAEVALSALTEWRYLDSGERCRCSCHPRLPDSDLHDYGFDCACTRTREQRRATVQQWLNDLDAYRKSPDGQHARAAAQAAEAELHAWLAQHPGVVVDSYGGWAPEQWTGEIDGHSFYFRERHDDWRIEIDLRPTGRFVNVIDTHDVDGTARSQQHELEQGDVIATGYIDAEGYGTTLVERAQFILTTIRDHLTQKTCAHPLDVLDAIATLFGGHLQWCPACGTRLGATTTDVGDAVVR